MFTLAAASSDAVTKTSDAINHARGTLIAAIHGDPNAVSAVIQQYLLPVLWAVIILVIFWFVAMIAKRIIRRSLVKSDVEQTLARFAGKLAFYTIMALGTVFALSKFGINVTSFAALLAAVGFAIGIAMSGSLANVAAGVMLMLFRPFKVGQYVKTAGVAGTVEEIELFCTTLDTADNRRIIVPNSKIFNAVIENNSHHSERRLDVSVNVSYEADIDQTRQALEQMASNIEETVQGEGRGHQVVLGNLGDSAVGWTVRVWLKSSDYWSVKEKVTRNIKLSLKQAGIGIALPAMSVRMDNPQG